MLQSNIQNMAYYLVVLSFLQKKFEIRIQTGTCLYINGHFTVPLKMRWPKQMANLTNWNYKQRGESQVALGRDL